MIIPVTSSEIIFSDPVIERNSNWLSDMETLMENPHIPYQTGQSGNFVKDVAFDLVSLRIGFEARNEDACTENIGRGRCQMSGNIRSDVSDVELHIIVINYC